MQVSNPNNVKIYNLSLGKTLPEWLSDQKKRSMQKKDIDIQRRIQLLQDFDMPQVSNNVQISNDGQYILATGVYKPRIRCYDVAQMSLKFERCVDSEIVKFHMLEDDYTKFILLQNDRYVEFHAQHGRYYRTRIPKYGRDMSYHKASCDLYVVGASSEVYRLNLEQGKFMNSLQSAAEEIHCCQFNPHHDLFSFGTTGGKVESWDPRVRNRVGLLDVTSGIITDDEDVLEGVPTVTALTYNGPLNYAVGTSSGHVLLYDIRSSKPLLVKDHRYGLPIKKVVYCNDNQDLVMSIDKKVLKIWHKSNGKAYTAIEPGTGLNDLCLVPNSGLFFMANEAPKVLTYYIPAVGPAPKWCYFLDNLTEELEESATPMVYDDYQFATRKDLEGLGLTHLIGTNLLRAYMHGYFMDMRLYKKDCPENAAILGLQLFARDGRVRTDGLIFNPSLLYIGGSSFEQLKIGHPDEYDFMIILLDRPSDRGYLLHEPHPILDEIRQMKKGICVLKCYQPIMLTRAEVVKHRAFQPMREIWPDIDQRVGCLSARAAIDQVHKYLLKFEEAIRMGDYDIDTKAIAEPFAYEEYKKQKIRAKIEGERVNRVQVMKLPKVNKQLAEKLMDVDDGEPVDRKKKKKAMTNLLKDDRFSALFANPDFEVDTDSPEYRLLNPVVSKMDKVKRKQTKLAQQQFQEVDEGADEKEGRPSSDEESESSDDEHTWAAEVKQQHRQIRHEARLQEMTSSIQEVTKREEELSAGKKGKAKFLELKEGESYGVLQDRKRKRMMTRPLGERLAAERDDVIKHGGINHGGREMTFTLKKTDRELARRKEMIEHHQERRKIRRSAGDITKNMKAKPKFYMGKRVK